MRSAAVGAIVTRVDAAHGGIHMKRSPRQPKARGRTDPALMSPQAKRRQRSATAAVRRDTTLLQSDVPRRVETRMAPPKYAERRHARPGAGIKRSRANTSSRSR
jgi:hypothetical protein